jgi:hypothetical protein
MILIICAWIYYFLLSLSIGAGLLKWFAGITGSRSTLRFGIFYQFWFGFAVLIGLLQMVSLFLPVGKIVFVLISLLGLFFMATNFKAVRTHLRLFYERLTTFRGVMAVMVVFILMLLVSYVANKEVLLPDTFIYHFNGVKWAKEYPAVPGLANLHGRLGFNSSFFLFAAFTDIWIYEGQSVHIALSFIMMMCIIHWFFIIASRNELMAKKIFCLITLPFLIFHAAYQPDIASLSTDYPTAVLIFIFCIVLLDKLKHKSMLLLPLSAVVFSFKLSGMLLILTAVVIAAGYLVFSKFSAGTKAEKRSEIKLGIASTILPGFIICGFIARNIIVSGWLLYPFPVGNLHLPWSVPTPYVLDMMDWIKSFPKLPSGASPAIIKSNNLSFWFFPWLAQFRMSGEFNFLCIGTILLLGVVFRVSSIAKFLFARLNIVILIGFAAASILFWFFSAPDIRFGSIYFYIFLAGSTILLFEASRHKAVLSTIIYIACIHQVIQQLPAYGTNRPPDLFTFGYTKPQPLVKVIASPPGENPPLYIYMPAQGNACGGSPLPCTPYAGGLLHNHQLLRQRKPGDLSKGFLPTEN